MKKNSFKTAVLMTIISLPLAMYLIGVKPLTRSDSESALSFVEAEENIDVSDTSADALTNDVIENDGSATAPAEEAEEDLIVIDIAGEVAFPGVYALKEGSRIIDAIEMAGGLTYSADVIFINRAEIIYDGSKIYIPSKEEGESGVITSFTSTPRRIGMTGVNQLININTASSEELQKIPGVGPSTAEKIISYRLTYGKFNSIEDLINVSGIGNKTLEKMKGYITVR